MSGGVEGDNCWPIVKPPVKKGAPSVVAEQIVAYSPKSCLPTKVDEKV